MHNLLVDLPQVPASVMHKALEEMQQALESVQLLLLEVLLKVQVLELELLLVEMHSEQE